MPEWSRRPWDGTGMTIKSLICAFVVAVSSLSGQPVWVPMMGNGDATRYSYPNRSTPRKSCLVCNEEQTSGISAAVAIAWPEAECPDANDPVSPTAFYCQSSQVQSASNLYPPGPALWWTSVNPDGSRSQDLSGWVLSRPTSVTYRNTVPVAMTGFKVAANISSSGTGTKNIYFNLTDNYSGGPEFGFVFDSANVDDPMYFYWSTNANCGGNPDLGLHSFCTDARCQPGYSVKTGEPQCTNQMNDVYENAYRDSSGGVHQVDMRSHHLALPGAYDQDLVYVAYLDHGSNGGVIFHVEIDYPNGEVFQGLTFDVDPNAMGFGRWYPSEEIYSGAPGSSCGYLTITVQPGRTQPSGTALTITQISYGTAGQPHSGHLHRHRTLK